MFTLRIGEGGRAPPCSSRDVVDKAQGVDSGACPSKHDLLEFLEASFCGTFLEWCNFKGWIRDLVVFRLRSRLTELCVRKLCQTIDWVCF